MAGEVEQNHTAAGQGNPPFMDPTVRRNRDWFWLCDYFIESAEPWAGTYCKLRTGHDGPHAAHFEDGASACPRCHRTRDQIRSGEGCGDYDHCPGFLDAR